MTYTVTAADATTQDYTVTVNVPPVWYGNYHIQNQSDIDLFKDYTSITGDLVIEVSSLSTLTGLENLNSINGGLIVRNNANLLNLNGLVNLTSVGSIYILYPCKY